MQVQMISPQAARSWLLMPNRGQMVPMSSV
jgi:hypothetical protein